MLHIKLFIEIKVNTSVGCGAAINVSVTITHHVTFWICCLGPMVSVWTTEASDTFVWTQSFQS